MLRLVNSKKIWLVAILQIVLANAQAQQPVCSTLGECVALRKQVVEQIEKFGGFPNFIDTLEEAAKRPLSTQDGAEYNCKQRGARLPTIRELSQLASSFGAKGIVSTCDKGCHYIATQKKSDGTFDEGLLFNPEGYKYSHYNLSIWSSAISYYQSSFGWVFNANSYPFLTTLERYQKYGSFMCVKD